MTAFVYIDLYILLIVYLLSVSDYSNTLINYFIVEIMSKTRTAGDGMESAENASERVQYVDSKITTSPTRKDSLLPTRLVQVYATKVFRSEKVSRLNSKSPKFVPYEPYPAAVKPMTPMLITKDLKKSKNNMDINTLITQMSQMNTNLNEFKPRPKLNSTSDKSGLDPHKPSPEAVEMKKKIDSLTHENESLKEQLKQQVQVCYEYLSCTFYCLTYYYVVLFVKSTY